MSLPAAFLSPTKSMSSVGKVAGVAGGLIPLVVGVFIKTINEGEDGFRTRFGKALQSKGCKVLEDGTIINKGDVRPLRSGTFLAIPVLYSIRVIDVKIQAIDLPGRLMEDGNGVQRFVEASIEYQRGTSGANLRQSELGVTNELEVMSNHVASVLLEVVAEITDERLPPSRVISDRVLTRCRDDVLKQCGIIVSKIRITGCGLTPAEMQRQSMREIAEAIRETGGGAVVLPFPSSSSG